MDIIPLAVIVLFVFTMFSSVKGPDEKQRPKRPPVVADIVINQEIPQPYFEEVNKEQIIAVINKHNPRLPEHEKELIAVTTIENCRNFNVNPRIMIGLFRAESTYNKMAVSKSGAQGLGQLMPTTAKYLGVDDFFDIEKNIFGATKYIGMLLYNFRGNSKQVPLALASYKDGYGKITRASGKMSDETRAYVKRIIRVANSFN